MWLNKIFYCLNINVTCSNWSVLLFQRPIGFHILLIFLIVFSKS